MPDLTELFWIHRQQENMYMPSLAARATAEHSTKASNKGIPKHTCHDHDYDMSMT